MRARFTFVAASLFGASSLLAGPAFVRGQDPLSVVRSIEKGGKGVGAASEVAARLETGKEVSLEQIFAAIPGANPIAKNWLLALGQSVADKGSPATTRGLLQKTLDNQALDSDLRYWALDRLAGGDLAARKHLLTGRTDDSSLDIRFEAIELELENLKSAAEAAKSTLKEEPKTPQASESAAKLIAAYQALLANSRLPEQTNSIAKTLEELGSPVDLRSHFGFVANWQVIAPFDNRKGIGFSIAYAPEAEYGRAGKLDSKARFPGKSQEVTWTTASTAKPDGAVDLNPVFANEKGAVAYAYAEFTCPIDVKCEVRLGCINANKVWVNGKEAFANEVYHTGSQIDQYVGDAQLSKGTNSVLIKVCQNEQTESWAQDWQFQLRFTDATGKAISIRQ